MDYNEMLFAYYVQKEAEKRLAQDYPQGLSQQDFDISMDEVVTDIIGAIATTARRIEMLSRGD